MAASCLGLGLALTKTHGFKGLLFSSSGSSSPNSGSTGVAALPSGRDTTEALIGAKRRDVSARADCLNAGAVEGSRTMDARAAAGRHFWRRSALTAMLILPSPLCLCFDAAVSAVNPAVIDPSKRPSAPFDPADENLRKAAEIFQAALDADSVQEEESNWTRVIEVAESVPAETAWVNDILSRAYGNRGNARSRQGRMEEAINDYNKAIQLAPYAPDPVLNRGVALESLRRFQEAAADYQAVLDVDPRDPAAWNNLGNIMAATGKWEEAAADYKRAADLAPEFSFAAANLALAQYQLGQDNSAIKQMRSLLRRYPEFPDMRAALAVSLYSAGLIADAETNWTRLEDLRYRSVNWVKDVRRWPPRLVNELERFLKIAPS